MNTKYLVPSRCEHGYQIKKSSTLDTRPCDLQTDVKHVSKCDLSRLQGQMVSLLYNALDSGISEKSYRLPSSEDQRNYNYLLVYIKIIVLNFFGRMR